jgi:hypothetical protein
MRRLAILVVLALAGSVVLAEATKPASKPTAGKPAAKIQPPKGGAAKPATIRGGAAKPSSAKVPPKGSAGKTTRVHAKGSVEKPVKLAKTDAKASKADARVGKTSSMSTGVSTTPDFTATKVGQKLHKNSALRSKIETKLKAAGYTGSVYEAAYGFKNLGQFNAATNQVQNHGYSFELLKVLMTGTYVDPDTHAIYRTNRLPDGTIGLVSADLATNPASTRSLGQSKQSIVAGAEMPEIVVVQTTRTSGTGSTSRTGATSAKSKSGRKTAVTRAGSF